MIYKCSKKYNKVTNENGIICYPTLKELTLNLEDNSTIYLENEVYYGKVYIKNKNITIIGSENSVIDYDLHNSEIIRECDGGDGVKTYGTTGSSTMHILKDADNFKMEHVTVKNSFLRDESSKGGQAVAFKVESLNSYIKDCNFIGMQDTLYLEGNNHYLKDCYIEGDIDFIFGSADCVIDNATIKMERNNNLPCYMTAPSSYYNYGIVIVDSKILCNQNDNLYLGRGWYPGGATMKPSPKLMMKNCDINKDIKLDLIRMHEGNPERNSLYLNNIIMKGKKIKDNISDNKLSEYDSYIEKIRYENNI